jgi:hypothetical protein
LADLVPVVPEPDAWSLPPARLAQMHWAAPCTPGEVPCGERSYVAKEFGRAEAQLAQLVSLPLGSMPVVQRAPQKLEPQLGLREEAKPPHEQAAPVPAPLEARQQSWVVAQLGAPARKMSAAV